MNVLSVLSYLFNIFSKKKKRLNNSGHFAIRYPDIPLLRPVNPCYYLGSTMIT